MSDVRSNVEREDEVFFTHAHVALELLKLSTNTADIGTCVSEYKYLLSQVVASHEQIIEGNNATLFTSHDIDGMSAEEIRVLKKNLSQLMSYCDKKLK